MNQFDFLITIFTAFLLQIVQMVLGALRIANMWVAVFGDTGVALLVTANAIRVMMYGGKQK
ncbi:MAG: hypothetical protein M0P01_14575 [Treponema sp.]|nr:hypothetical protein [Treponema sp.]